MRPGEVPTLAATLSRRLLSLCYEALLFAAVLFTGALVFQLPARYMEPIAQRPLFQCYLLLIAGSYFIWQWLHGGQTLPMKTWRLKLLTRDGSPLTPSRAFCRFLLALLGLALFGGGFLWALFDRDRQFLHDRLAGTRIVKAEGERMKAER